MNVLRRWNQTSYILVAVLALSLSLLGSGCSSDEEDSVPAEGVVDDAKAKADTAPKPPIVNIMALRPDGAEWAIGIPPIAVLEERYWSIVEQGIVSYDEVAARRGDAPANPLADHREEVAELLSSRAGKYGAHDVTSFVEAAEAASVDPDQPWAVYLSMPETVAVEPGDEPSIVVAGSYTNETMFVEALNGLIAEVSEADEGISPFHAGEEKLGDGSVYVSENEGSSNAYCAFYLGYFFVSNDLDMLKATVLGAEQPAEIPYGTAQFPHDDPAEIVIWGDLAAITKNSADVLEQLEQLEQDGAQEGIAGVGSQANPDYLRQISDYYGDMVVTLSVKGEGVSINARGKVDPASPYFIEDAEPLDLLPYTPGNSPLLISVRVTEEAKKAYEDGVAGGLNPDQAGAFQYMAMVSSALDMFDDELVVASSPGGGFIPVLVALAEVSDVDQARGMLGLANARPTGQDYNGYPIYVAQAGIAAAEITFVDDILVAATEPATFRGTVDAIAAGQPKGGFPDIVKERDEIADFLLAADLQQVSQTAGPFMTGITQENPGLPFVMSALEEFTMATHPVGEWPASYVELKGDIGLLAAGLAIGAEQRAAATVPAGVTSAGVEDDLKELMLAAKMFANEEPEGYWPPLSETPGRLMMAPEAVYPEYISDLGAFIDPENPAAPPLGDYDTGETDPAVYIDDHSYIYLGHAIRNEAEGLAFVEGYRARAEAGEDLTEDYMVDGVEVLRLREGVDLDLVEDGEEPSLAMMSEIVVMFQRPGPDTMTEGVVGYMDGHVERVPFGEFPYTDTFLEGLSSIDE